MSDALLGAVRSAWQEAAAGTAGLRAWRAVRTPVPGPLTVLAAIRETDGALSVLFEAAIESAPSARARFEADGIGVVVDSDGMVFSTELFATVTNPQLTSRQKFGVF